MALSRLRDRLLQQRQAVQHVRSGADRRRRAMVHQYGSGRNAQASQGETGKRQPANRDQSVYARLVSDRVHLLRRPVSGGMASRSRRYGGGGISRTDGGMRALSRSQVRSHQPARLLPPVGALRRQRGTRNSTGEFVRRSNQLAQLSLA